MLNRNRTAVLLLFPLAVALTAGCSSPSQGEKMVQGFTRTRKIVVDAKGKVDATVITLSSLRTAPPQFLSDAYRQYKDAVGRLEEEGADASWRATAVKEEADAHIKAWQREMEDIKDPMIKASLESRREAVRTNFKLVQMYADDARKAYQPYLQSNKQIVQALAIDLSPAAMTSMGPAMERVVAEGNALKQKIAAMEHALDNIANGVSPIGEMQ